MTEHDALALIDALQLHYLRALDRRDMTAWLACFDAAAGSYLCLSSENEEQGLPLPLMMDDCPARLKDRVRFITEVWSGTFEDYATRHFTQRLEHRQVEEGRYTVLSNFMVVYTSARRHSEILVAGSYEDDVAVDKTAARFLSKRAILDTVTAPRYLVYPV